MVVTCNDADVCTYLENILGFRQTGDADIHADTKATVDAVQSPTVGLGIIAANTTETNDDVDEILHYLDDIGSTGLDIGDWLVNILGIRQSGQNDIHADTLAAITAINNGTSGLAAIKTAVNTVETHAAAVDTNLGSNVNGKASISDYLVNILGTRQAGEADIHADAQAIADILQLAGHGGHPTAGLLAALGYPNGSVNTPAEDANRIIADFALVTTLNNLIGSRLGDALGNLGDLFYTIAIDFLNATGHPIQTPIARLLYSLNAAPAFTDLHTATPVAIDSTAIVDRPDGAYGLQLFLDVPGDWGVIDQVPNVYVPAVARVFFFSSLGVLVGPQSVDVEFPTYYPLQSACSKVQIKLGVGVSGTFSWLLL